jgi:hypothetical protein
MWFYLVQDNMRLYTMNEPSEAAYTSAFVLAPTNSLDFMLPAELGSLDFDTLISTGVDPAPHWCEPSDCAASPPTWGMPDHFPTMTPIAKTPSRTHSQLRDLNGPYILTYRDGVSMTVPFELKQAIGGQPHAIEVGIPTCG